MPLPTLAHSRQLSPTLASLHIFTAQLAPARHVLTRIRTLEDRLAQLDVVAEDLPQTPAEASTNEEGFPSSSE